MPLLSAAQNGVISPTPLALQRLGLIEFPSALEIQRSLHAEVATGSHENTLRKLVALISAQIHQDITTQISQ